MTKNHALQRLGAFAALVLLAIVALCTTGARPAAAAAWLFASDIHVDPRNLQRTPSHFGNDTNVALLESTIAAMQRAEPNPPVVVLAGDYLGHGRYDPATATAVITSLARRFDRAFPRAQFVLALGNEDSACGDYGIAPDAPFLKAVATAWAPLVNRHGAAPAFAKTFAHDGFYTATLPVPGLRAIVVDDIFWSPRYHRCGGSQVGGAETLAELASALHSRPTMRTWLVLHIPPGVDAFSTTHLAHRMVVVPFLDSGPREQLTELVNDPHNHVALLIGGHAHRFAYRLIDAGRPRPAPMLIVPSVSPIFRNNPSFLRVDVRADGTVANAREFSLVRGDWTSVGDLHALGMAAFTTPAVLDLQARLAHDPALRARFADLYGGGATPEITEGNWHAYWCAGRGTGVTAFRGCMESGGYSIFTARGLIAGFVLAGSVVAIAAGLALLLRARLRGRNLRGMSGR